MLTMRSAADDVQMTYTPADDIQACGRCADDMRMTYVIRQLKSPTKSHSRVVRAPSARRLHETSVPRLFSVIRRTALLKTKTKLPVLPAIVYVKVYHFKRIRDEL